MKNSKKYYELKIKVNRKLREFSARDKNAVEIYGNLQYLSENQLRALQLVVKEAFEEDESKGLELQENIVIYNNLHKRKATKTIQICRNGYLDDALPGFYDANQEMSLELL